MSAYAAIYRTCQPLKFSMVIVRFEFNYFSSIMNFYKSITYRTKLKLHKTNNKKWVCYIKIIKNSIYLVDVGRIGICYIYMMVIICTILNKFNSPFFHTFVICALWGNWVPSTPMILLNILCLSYMRLVY